jgi:chromate transport protein ChrA
MIDRPPYSLAQLTLYFLKLGTIGFGAPVALVGYMYRDLVEKRPWITDEDYKEGLTLAQLMSGPLAAQLAMYLGYVHYRIAGATVVGIAFVLPSFLMVVAIGAITGAVIVLAERSINDWITALIALVAVGLLWKVKKLPEPALVAIAAVIGFLAFPGMRS